MFFSVVVRLEAPDKRFILWTPGWIVTPVNYFQIEKVLSLTVSDSVLRIRVYLTKNKTEKSLNGKKKGYKSLGLNVLLTQRIPPEKSKTVF